MSAARPPEGAKAPLGGSDPREAGERGGELSAAQLPEGAKAPISRGAAHRRWTLTLFVAAVAVFWGCLWLSGALFPDREDKRVYNWPADAAAVRQVVIEVPGSSADLSWSSTEAPRLETDEPSYAETRLLLAREGDTLYVRSNPAAQADGRRYRQGNMRLYLPLSVGRVVGDGLSMYHSQAPAQLELVGQSVHVRTKSLDRSFDRLRVVGVGTRCESTRDKVSSDLFVEASGLTRLEVETLGGSVKLEDLSAVTAVSLRGPDDVTLSIDRVGDLARLALGPLPPERAAELGKLVEAMEALSPEASCRSRVPRMKAPANGG